MTEITITAEDIEFGLSESRTCPAAWATNRVLDPKFHASFGSGSMSVHRTGNYVLGLRRTEPLPLNLIAFIHDFDGGKQRPPNNLHHRHTKGVPEMRTMASEWEKTKRELCSDDFRVGHVWRARLAFYRGALAALELQDAAKHDPKAGIELIQTIMEGAEK